MIPLRSLSGYNLSDHKRFDDTRCIRCHPRVKVWLRKICVHTGYISVDVRGSAALDIMLSSKMPNLYSL